MTNNIFKNAKFGDKFQTRNGNIAIYLSKEHRGHIDDKYNPPFVLVHVALERHVKYTDGSENRFHDIIMYDESGHFNRFDVDNEYPEYIVSYWKEPVDTVKIRKYFNYDVKNQPYNNLYVCDADSYEAGYRKAIEL